MALADYYERGALAASQVLSGFDEERIRQVLQGHRIGVFVTSNAALAREGHSSLDLLVRILARFYPTLVIEGGVGTEALVNDLKALATSINPALEFVSEPTVQIVVGQGSFQNNSAQQIYVGSSGWVSCVGTEHPYKTDDTENPFGAGVASCLAAANAFRFVFMCADAELDRDVTFSTSTRERDGSSDLALNGEINLVLVGCGAIGNAAAWALARLPASGTLHLVDHEDVDLGNLQRYVMSVRADENQPKVDVLQRYFTSGIAAQPHKQHLDQFLSSKGYSWPAMALALDSARDRCAAQASLPRSVVNAWTQPGDLGVSVHDFVRGACVLCLYLPEHALENEDQIITNSFGVPDRLVEIRTLLYNGLGVPRSLLEAISAARGLDLELLLPFEDQPVRDLYVRGFCGGAVIPIGHNGQPRHEVHVPLAHQSALAGLLLAAAATVHSRVPVGGTRVTRLNLLKSLGESFLTQPAGKDPRGICICQDADYQFVYAKKYNISGE